MDYRTLILALSVCLFFSCQSNDKDYFYTAYAWSDLIRVPLLKPFELISPDDGYSWFFNRIYRPKINNDTKTSIADKFNVKDSIVIIYAEDIYIKSQFTEAWIITDLKTKTESVFIKKKGIFKIFGFR